MPNVDIHCHSIIFNGNILISGYENKNILIYSIDIDSFSTIPYEFAKEKAKLLINAEKLYLIECGHGWIYESSSEDEYSWWKIAASSISYFTQASCLYNKGGIYIGCSGYPYNHYFKFSLEEKVMIEL